MPTFYTMRLYAAVGPARKPKREIDWLIVCIPKPRLETALTRVPAQWSPDFGGTFICTITGSGISASQHVCFCNSRHWKVKLWKVCNPFNVRARWANSRRGNTMGDVSWRRWGNGGNAHFAKLSVSYPSGVRVYGRTKWKAPHSWCSGIP